MENKENIKNVEEKNVKNERNAGGGRGVRRSTQENRRLSETTRQDHYALWGTRALHLGIVGCECIPFYT